MAHPTPPETPDGQPPSADNTANPEGLPLPHEREQQAGHVNPDPDPHMQRAAHDLKRGQVDTDLRQTPGLDAERRGALVDGGERGAGDQQGDKR